MSQFMRIVYLSHMRKIILNPFKYNVLIMGHPQDQTPQNAASDQVPHCLLIECTFKIE